MNRKRVKVSLKSGLAKMIRKNCSRLEKAPFTLQENSTIEWVIDSVSDEFGKPFWLRMFLKEQDGDLYEYDVPQELLIKIRDHYKKRKAQKTDGD